MHRDRLQDWREHSCADFMAGDWEMRPTLRERWIKWMFAHERTHVQRHSYYEYVTWRYAPSWGAATLLCAVGVLLARWGIETGWTYAGIQIAFLAVILYFIWERYGWMQMIE